MIERLQRALDEVEHLSPDVQEQLAEQIEALVRTVSHSTKVQTPAGSLEQRLTELRKQIVDSGAPLLSWDGVEAEVAERRGERAADTCQ